MKKLLFLLMMGLFLIPTTVFADHHYSHKTIPADQELPVRSPYCIETWINSETGVFSILANYDITCLYVTIEQNNVMLDSFSQALYNGIPAIYNFAGYSTGEYIVTLSTVDGIIAQYLVTVEED